MTFKLISSITIAAMTTLLPVTVFAQAEHSPISAKSNAGPSGTGKTMAASAINKLEETDDTKPVSAQDGDEWPLFRVDIGRLAVAPENGSSGGPRGDWAWEISRTGVMINSSSSTGKLLELGVLTKQQAALLKAG